MLTGFPLHVKSLNVYANVYQEGALSLAYVDQILPPSVGMPKNDRPASG